MGGALWVVLQHQVGPEPCGGGGGRTKGAERECGVLGTQLGWMDGCCPAEGLGWNPRGSTKAGGAGNRNGDPSEPNQQDRRGSQGTALDLSGFFEQALIPPWVAGWLAASELASWWNKKNLEKTIAPKK